MVHSRFLTDLWVFIFKDLEGIQDIFKQEDEYFGALKVNYSTRS